MFQKLFGRKPDQRRAQDSPHVQGHPLDRGDGSQDTFVRREQMWWESALSKTEQTVIESALHRYALGGVPTFPYVHRPFDYGTFASYPEVSLMTSRKLTDRGLAIVKDAESRHFILLSGIKREWAFKLADDPVSNARLLDYARKLQENRPAAERIMQLQWDELPPNRGEEYDAMPFNLEDRRIRFIYRHRNDDPTAIDRTIETCRAMIARSPEFIQLFRELGKPLPTHKGYEQLAIILDKHKDYAEAVAVCRRAASEGWDGDWGRRIERYSRKVKPADT